MFAFKVAKHVKSNAIVYAKDGATVGIGAGQMSRVDSARIAALKAADAAKAAGERSRSPRLGGGLRRLLPLRRRPAGGRRGRRHRRHPARRLHARRRGHRRRRRQPASPWSSPASATSAIDSGVRPRGSDPCDTCHAPLCHCRLLVRRGRRLGRRRPRFEVVLRIRRDARRGRRRGAHCHGGLAGRGARRRSSHSRRRDFNRSTRRPSSSTQRAPHGVPPPPCGEGLGVGVDPRRTSACRKKRNRVDAQIAADARLRVRLHPHP